MREALSKDVHGLYNYSTICWSDLKKSGKTTIAAAVAACISFTKDAAKIRFVGNDLKQADSRVFNALKDAIRLNPDWRETVRVVNHKVLFPNGSIIESVPVDPVGEAGGNDDMIEYTELWGANTEAHKKLWTETTLSPTKFGRSFRWIDTYAGFVGESETLENLYQQCVKPEYHLDLSYTDSDGVFHDLSDLEVYANPQARIFCLWNTVPRLSWQTQAYYDQEAGTLRTNDFLRIHKNQWVSSASAFITKELWEACREPKLQLLPNEALYLSLDAGIVDDNFGITACSARQVVVMRKASPDAIAQPAWDTGVCAHLTKLWEPPENGKVSFEEVEAYLYALKARYRIVEIAYDPYQLADMAQRLERKFGDILYQFNQGAERMQADRQLYNLIKEKRLHHNAGEELTNHVLNANAKTTGEYDHIRLVKRSQKLKIDLAVSLSMSAWRAYLNGTPIGTSMAMGIRVTLAQADHHLPPNPLARPLPQVQPKQSSGYAVVKRKERGM